MFRFLNVPVRIDGRRVSQPRGLHTTSTIYLVAMLLLRPDAAAGQAPPAKPQPLPMPPAITPPPGIAIESARPVTPVAVEKFIAGKIPRYLAGATIFAQAVKRNPKPEFGVIEVKLSRDVPLLLAASWESDGSKSGDWPKEVVEYAQMLANGWTLLGNVVFHDPTIAKHLLLYRSCKAGETLKLRTRKYNAPLVIVAAEGAPAPWSEVPAADMDPAYAVPILTSVTHRLLLDRKFDELEAKIKEFRGTKARFANGASKLVAAYGGLSGFGETEDRASGGGRKTDDWEDVQKALEAWVATQPNSIAAHLASAHFWERYAWDARGGGYAYKVTDEGGKLFQERVQKAKGLLEKAKQIGNDDPHRCEIEMQLAIDLGYERDEVYRILKDAQEIDPDYIRPFVGAVRYFLPRWHGEAGDLEQFALDAVKMTEKTWGHAVYLWIVWEARAYHGEHVFDDFKFDWNLVLKGLEDSRRRLPDTQVDVERTSVLACYQGDRDTARRLFTEFKETDAPVAQYMENYRCWSRADFREGEQAVVCDGVRKPTWTCEWFPDGRSFAVVNSAANMGIWSDDGKTRFAEFVHAERAARLMRIADDEKSVFAVTAGERIVTVDLQNGGEELLAEYGERLSAFAFSPDGRTFVAGVGPTKLIFWDVAARKAVDTWEDVIPAAVAGLAFSNDGKTLLVGQGDGRVLFYDRTTKKPTSELQSGASVRSLRTSADGRRIVVFNRNGLSIWDFDGKHLGALPAPRQAINDLSLSPDGLRLAAACGVSKPLTDSEVVLWDLETFAIRRTYHGHKASVQCVRFSPDGKRLLSGSDDLSVRIWNVD
jgi:hypothetical protein